MARQIIVQPDGQLCVYSTVVDTIVMWNFTDDELVEHLAQEEAQRVRERIRVLIEKVRAGERAYFQWTLGFVEAYGQHLSVMTNTGAELDDLALPAEVLAAAAAVRDRINAELEED